MESLQLLNLKKNPLKCIKFENAHDFNKWLAEHECIIAHIGYTQAATYGINIILIYEDLNND